MFNEKKPEVKTRWLSLTNIRYYAIEQTAAQFDVFSSQMSVSTYVPPPRRLPGREAALYCT
jgi:hypothetical protein